ncbi:MAG: hypothetical protein RLZZ182_2061 [Pseudomonadota bacterium]
MTPPVLVRRTASGALALTVVWLAGCASLPPDGGLAPVAALTAPHLGTPLTAPTSAPTSAPHTASTPRAERVAELLAQPLTADSAVQIALLQSPVWQQRFAQLGVAEADRVAATRLPNPTLGISRSRQGDSVSLEHSVGLNLVSLLSWPVLRDLEQQQLAQTRLDSAQAVLRLAHDVKQAWVDAVAARATREQAERLLDAADAARTLADRMQQAGHWSGWRRDQEASFRAEAEQALHEAQARDITQRDRLTRLLGLPAPDAFQLPDHLPTPQAPPASPEALGATVQQALGQRLDVRMAQTRAEQQARALGLSRATRLVNVLDIEGFQESTTDEARKRGVAVHLELPLFDLGQSRIDQQAARYQAALADTRAAALTAQSQVREAWQHWRLVEARARQQREEVLPRRQRMAEHLLQRYNGMLSSVFDLLADARLQQQAVQQALALDAAAWAAHMRFELALVADPGSAPAGPSAPSAGARGTTAPHD